MQNGAEEVRIGSERNTGDSANESFWGDKIDEVSVFGDVLTAAEITNLLSRVPYEITSPYLEADLPGLQKVQSADVLYKTHTAYPPNKLIRHAHAFWELEEIEFNIPPFLAENITETTITPSAKTGTITLTSTPRTLFTPDHVDSFWEIRYPRENNKVEVTFAATAKGTILTDVKGTWRMRTSGTWTGVLELQRTYDDQLVLVLDAAPTSAWVEGDVITGASSGETCIIVAVTDTTHYRIKHLTGSFTPEEILSNGIGTRDTGSGFPQYEGWHVIDTYESKAGPNFSITGEEDVGNAYFRVECTEHTNNDIVTILSCEQFYHTGYVKITGFTNSSEVTALVKRTLGGTTATKLWSEGAWSDERGYPASPAFYEGRLWFAGTPFRPLDIWGGVTGDYENFERGDLATDSVKFTIDSSQQNIIRWLVGQDVLQIGTSGAEWKLGSVDVSDPITPTNPIKPRIQTTYGSKEIQAQLLANVVIFVGAMGKTVRGSQYVYEQGANGGYDAPSYSLFSEDLTQSGIIQMAYQQNPYPILWCVTADGTLIGMVFEPGQKIWGWFDCDIDGLVESVAIIRGEVEDEIWIIVKRTINGVVKRYVEYFKPRDWGEDQADCFFVDSGLTFDGGDSQAVTGITKASPAVVTVETWPTDGDGNDIANGDNVRIRSVVGMTEINDKVYTVANADVTAKTMELRDALDDVDIDSTGFTLYDSGGAIQKVSRTFSGLSHLEAETVSVLGDGSVHKDVVVSSATIMLDFYYNKVQVGKGFTSRLMPMPLEIQGGGSLRAKSKRIHQLLFSFLKTLGAKYGTDESDDKDTIIFRKTTDPIGSPPELFTGTKLVTFEGGYELDGDIYVEQDQPLPLTVRTIIARLAVYE